MRSEVNNFPCYRSASYAWSRRPKYNSHLQKFKVQTPHHSRNLESQWHIRNKRANVRAIYIDYPFANPTNVSETQLFSWKSNAFFPPSTSRHLQKPSVKLPSKSKLESSEFRFAELRISWFLCIFWISFTEIEVSLPNSRGFSIFESRRTGKKWKFSENRVPVQGFVFDSGENWRN